jgi:hypothetical protein
VEAAWAAFEEMGAGSDLTDYDLTVHLRNTATTG